jgi:hypothetical protein
MENILEKTEKVYKLINHDSHHTKPQFESFTISEYNEQFETNYNSVEDATESDPEYLFSHSQMLEYLEN